MYSNLHEFGCPVPHQAYTLLVGLGRSYAAAEWGWALGITPKT